MNKLEYGLAHTHWRVIGVGMGEKKGEEKQMEKRFRNNGGTWNSKS